MSIPSTIKTIVGLWIIVALAMSVTVFTLNQGVTEQNQNIEKAQGLVNDIFTLNILTNDYIINREERAQIQWIALQEKILMDLEEINLSGGENELISLGRNMETIKNIFSQLVKNYDDIENTAIADDFEARIVGQLSSVSQDMVSESFLLSAIAQDNISEIQTKISLVNLIFLFVMFLIAGVGGMIMLRGVAKPVAALADSEKKSAELNDVLRIINTILRHDVLRRMTGARWGLEMHLSKEKGDWIKHSQTAIMEGIEVINQMKELEGFVSAGKELKPVNLKEMIAPLAKTYEIPVEIDGKGTVLADQALSSIFDNLIRNAIIHGRSTKVQIQIKDMPKMLQIEVIDDGSGIPKAIRKKVFKEGFTSGESGNTGLGLYIVKKTLNRYCGKIRIKDNVKKGNTFVITLPKA